MYGTMTRMLFAGLLLTPAVWAVEPSPEMLAGTCSSCHGIDGNSEGPASPTIAGLSEEYFIGAMLSYKFSDDIDKAWDLIEKDPELGNVVVLKRAPSIMDPLAQGYTVAEIKTMARHYAGKEFEAPYQAYDARSATRRAARARTGTPADWRDNGSSSSGTPSATTAPGTGSRPSRWLQR